MPAAVDPSGSTCLDAPLQSLLTFCTENAIFISPSISPRRIPGRGVGVYSIQPIRPGQKLIHVPTKALLTGKTVPDTFLDREARKQFSVHGLLALYLAFGDDQNLKRLDRWRSTWPGLEEFVNGMPVFWGNDIETRINKNDHSSATVGKEPERKRRKVSEPRNGTLGSNTLQPKNSSPSLEALLPPSTRHLQETIASKIATIINKAAEHFPDLDLSFSPSPTPQLLTFLHTWSLTNTRCFYYVPPGTRAPTDPNEAMALVPFMDLFNHISSNNSDSLCTVKFSKLGYTVYAPTRQSTPASTELYLNYGAHDNDALWTEYGFIPPGGDNADDKVSLDACIMKHLTPSHQRLLEHKAYLGDYSIRADHDGTGAEICWRTEVVAWLLTLSDGAGPSSGPTTTTTDEPSTAARRKWSAIVDGHYIPAEDKGENGADDKATTELLRRHRTLIHDWISALNRRATEAIDSLRALDRSSTIDDTWFQNTLCGLPASPPAVSMASSSQEEEEEEEEEEWPMKTPPVSSVAADQTPGFTVASRRIHMCLTRWEQIGRTTRAALRKLDAHDTNMTIRNSK